MYCNVTVLLQSCRCFYWLAATAIPLDRYCHFWNGVRNMPLELQPLTGPFSTPVNGGAVEWRQINPEKTFSHSQCHFIHHKGHIDCLDERPGCSSEKLATNIPRRVLAWFDMILLYFDMDYKIQSIRWVEQGRAGMRTLPCCFLLNGSLCRIEQRPLDIQYSSAEVS